MKLSWGVSWVILYVRRVSSSDERLKWCMLMFLLLSPTIRHELFIRSKLNKGDVLDMERMLFCKKAFHILIVRSSLIDTKWVLNEEFDDLFSMDFKKYTLDVCSLKDFCCLPNSMSNTFMLPLEWPVIIASFVLLKEGTYKTDHMESWGFTSIFFSFVRFWQRSLIKESFSIDAVL